MVLILKPAEIQYYDSERERGLLKSLREIKSWIFILCKNTQINSWYFGIGSTDFHQFGSNRLDSPTPKKGLNFDINQRSSVSKIEWPTFYLFSNSRLVTCEALNVILGESEFFRKFHGLGPTKLSQIRNLLIQPSIHYYFLPFWEWLE